jgi:hypothetical protein
MHGMMLVWIDRYPSVHPGQHSTKRVIESGLETAVALSGSWATTHPEKLAGRARPSADGTGTTADTNATGSHQTRLQRRRRTSLTLPKASLRLLWRWRALSHSRDRPFRGETVVNE